MTQFEIQTVINSKLREKRIDENSIAVSDIVEDLVTEVISSPLIEKERKSSILENLKKMYFQGELIAEVEELSLQYEQTDELAKDKFKALIKRRMEMNKIIDNLESKKIEDQQKLSTLFAQFASIMLVITAIISFLGVEKLRGLDQSLNDFINNYEFFVPLIMGLLTSLLAGVAVYFFRKRKISTKS